ncbi:MAG: DUF2723 domain-containing protein [Candidatus Goldbacteria bacterium]|nr:DUF2723 domain-containing protein [Candidatus Goldiibacteriota bacterium]
MKKIVIKEFIFLPIIFIIIFYIYLNCLFPAYKNNDSPEIAAATYTLGICHPPGYPFYIMFSKIFSLIPVGNISFRLNIFSSILAILILLFTYFILKNISIILFQTENKLYSIISIFILAFSYIFWNQAIETKGGIYHLNLLFLSIIIFLFIKILINFKMKYLYLLIYLYSLSLTNHWPSMIILFPVIFYIICLFKKDLKTKNLFYIFLFFITGLSVYSFLLIRDAILPIINFGDTVNIKDLFDFIARKPYAGEIIKFSVDILFKHFKVFIELFLQNYWFLWIFSIPGFYILFNKYKIIFFTFLYILFIVFLAVVVYNRTRLEIIWLIKIFLIPFQYIILIFISIGIFYILNKYKKFFFIILSLIILIHIKNNSILNNRAKDFLAYDLAFNIFNTLKENSYYFTEHDMYFFPILYEQTVNKKRNDIKLIPLTFLQFHWGREFIEKKYDYIISNLNFPNYYNEIIYQSLKKSDIIYRDFSSDLFDKILKINYITGYSGLLKTISNRKLSESSLIYKLYTYRGFYSKFAKTDENIELITRYMIFSALHAEKLLDNNRFEEAIQLYNFALLIPVEKLEYLIFYKLSICYNNLKNYDKELYYLNKCIQSKPDYLLAYERLGIYYYERGLKKEAKKHLENAIRYGSTNTRIIELYNNL